MLVRLWLVLMVCMAVVAGSADLPSVEVVELQSVAAPDDDACVEGAAPAITPVPWVGAPVIDRVPPTSPQLGRVFRPPRTMPS